MSVNLGTVYASVELRLDKMRLGIRDAQRDLKGFEASLDRLATNTARIGQRMSLAITAPVLLLGREAINTAAKLDSLNMGIRAVDGEATDLGKTLKKLDEIAKLPGLGLVQAREGYVNLRAAGINADFATRSLKAFGNALATVGKGKAELDGVNYALVQLANRTSGFGQEIRQLQNFLPQIRQAMQAAFGTTDSEKISKSGITGMQFLESLVKHFEGLPQVVGGARNALENFDDLLIKLKDSIGKALLPSLIKWMEDLAPKIQAATDWFNKLDPAAKNTFANMTVALAVGGPLMIGLSALISSLTTINAAMLALARNPLLIAILAGGATTAFMAGGGGDAIQRGMNTWLDNFKASIGLPGLKLPTPTVGPFAKRQKYGNQLGEVMRPGAGGMLNLSDFMPYALGGKKAGTPPPRDRPLTIADPEAVARAKRIAELNRQAQYDLADPVKQAHLDMAKNISEGMSRQNARGLFRKRLNEILEDLNKESFDIGKRDGGVLTNIMLGDGSLSPQFQATLRKTITQLRAKIAPMLNLDSDRMWELRTERGAKGEPETNFIGMINSMENALGGALAKAGENAKGRDLKGSPLDIREIGKQLANAADEAKRDARRFSFDVGKDLGANLAYEMGNEFSKTFDKIFGTGNPLARALNRTLSRLLDEVLYHAMTKGLSGIGLGGLFGGAGGGGIAEGAFGGGKGLGSMGTLSLLGGLAGAFIPGVGILAGLAGGGFLSGLFKASGGPVQAGMPYIVGERGPEWFVPKQSGTVLAGAGGINITIPGMVVRSEADIDRLAWQINRRMRSRPGS